jgi:hypothetical protein
VQWANEFFSDAMLHTPLALMFLFDTHKSFTPRKKHITKPTEPENISLNSVKYSPHRKTFEIEVAEVVILMS